MIGEEADIPGQFLLPSPDPPLTRLENLGKPRLDEDGIEVDGSVEVRTMILEGVMDDLREATVLLSVFSFLHLLNL